MEKYLTLVLLSLIATFGFGQGNYQDVVYLKNGSIIRGIIIEQVPNKSLKIETTDRSVFVYQMDEIEKLVKEPSKSNLAAECLEPGYKGIVEAGFNIGVGDGEGYNTIKINFINGYQIMPYLSVGIGTGIRFNIDYEEALIPLFADFRVNFLNKRLSPYASLGLGYTFDATYYFESVGFLVNTSAGISYKISNKSAVLFGLGYESQSWGYGYSTGAICINAGISF
ncbi:hypothetical protein MASR2M47_35060 [Draconibacterium sp.]